MARDGNPANRSHSPRAIQIGFSTLTRADIPRILEIERASFTHPWSETSFHEVVESRTFSSVAARLGNGELVGYIVFSEVADELHVLNVAVHPGHRKKGIASATLSYLHDLAAKRGRKFAYLEVRESNMSAQKLYSKFGYTTLTKRREYYADNRENAILMTAAIGKKRNG